jgi:hypothetical protein
MKLEHVRISLEEANAFVEQHHRHNGPVVGHVFSIGAVLPAAEADLQAGIVGVVIVGRPVSRFIDDGITAEVARLTTDGTRNACSFLYGCAARAAFALGFKRIGTYIMKSEGGASLRAAGWRMVAEVPVRSWDRPKRPRVDTHPLQERLRFECEP